jgi:hypothetical protein
MNTISITILTTPVPNVKLPLMCSNIAVRRIIATEKCEVNEIFLRIIAGFGYQEFPYNRPREILTANGRGAKNRRLPSPKCSAKLLSVGNIRKTNRL